MAISGPIAAASQAATFPAAEIAGIGQQRFGLAQFFRQPPEDGPPPLQLAFVQVLLLAREMGMLKLGSLGVVVGMIVSRD